MISREEFQLRLMAGRFWRRFCAALVLGYIYCAAGIAVVFAGHIAALVVVDGSIGEVARSLLYLPHHFPLYFIMAFAYGAYQIAIPTLWALPIVLAVALTLNLSRRQIAFVGACIGFAIGWPSYWKLAPVFASWLIAASSAAAGTAFAIGLWQACLRHYSSDCADPA